MFNDDAMNYNEYYAQQVGGALPYFTGSRVQRVHGFGSLLGGLLRTVAPLIKRGALALGNRALKGHCIEFRHHVALRFEHYFPLLSVQVVWRCM